MEKERVGQRRERREHEREGERERRKGEGEGRQRDGRGDGETRLSAKNGEKKSGLPTEIHDFKSRHAMETVNDVSEIEREATRVDDARRS